MEATREQAAYTERELQGLKELLHEKEARLKERGYRFVYDSRWEKDTEEEESGEETELNGYIEITVYHEKEPENKAYYEFCLYVINDDGEERFEVKDLCEELLSDVEKIEAKGKKAFKKILRRQRVWRSEIFPFPLNVLARLGVGGSVALALLTCAIPAAIYFGLCVIFDII